MKKVFTHENRLILFNIRNVLQGEGIETYVANEFAGGGAGDLPTFDTWPELWVEEESSYKEARKIVQAILSGNATDTWICQGCGEHNDAAFRLCWQCETSSE